MTKNYSYLFFYNFIYFPLIYLYIQNFIKQKTYLKNNKKKYNTYYF